MPALTPGTLAVAVSQSGETADTLASLSWCKAAGMKTAALVNVHSSTMAREAATICGRPMPGRRSASPRPRRSPAQVAALLALAVSAGVQRGRIDAAKEAELVKANCSRRRA
jgi:glucosamine--fructose-6-phosphate aminotransferase (isomerizing)